jgi:hypothetical protein
MTSSLSKDEYRRKFRVLDQMLTAHSTLRDRYRRRSVGLTLAVLALSVAATAVAFISGEKTVDIGIFSWHLQAVAGLLTVVIFLLALLDLVVDWRRDSWGHDDAARRLGELKLRFRGATLTDDAVDTGAMDLADEYERTMNAIVPVPDSSFLKLKAKHKRKIAISQMLDTEPGVPIWLLRLRLMWRDSRSKPVSAPRKELPATSEPSDVEAPPAEQEGPDGSAHRR